MNKEYWQLAWINQKLDSVIECECNEDGCKSCALKVNIQLPEVEVEDCEWNLSTINALPVAPQGVQKVEICNATPDIETITYCNKETDTQWLRREITTFDSDWVPTTDILSDIDLWVSCTDPKPDIETVELCINGTTHIQFYRFITSEDQTQTTRELIDTVDTWVSCVPTIKTITTKIDCAGTTASVDTTKTVEAVINQVVDTKQCTKEESISEIEVCAGTDTLIKKTVIDSEWSETITFYWDDWVVATPTTYTIGACKVAVPDVDLEFITGCSSIDGRFLVQRVSTDKLTDTDTITLLESDLTTVVTDGSTMVNCSGADYELASTACMENTTTGDKYQVLTFVNPTDNTDFYKIYVDVNGDVVNEPTGLTPCSNECESNMEFERCFDTGAGNVSVQGYYTLSAWNIETYTVAKVIASTDASYSVWDDVLADVPTWDQISCESPTEDEIDTPLTIVTGTGDVPAGFKSVTINNITGITIVAWGYELGDGRRDNSISFWTERWNNINELLPAITATGGTFQWIGLN